jgi:SNF2 family DNA or RNA helicase
MMKHQRAAAAKLSRVKVGALYMDMGTGKTRTALELGFLRMAQGKADCILWCCPVSVRKTIVDELQKHLQGISFEVLKPRRIRNPEADVYIAGIESMSSSIRLNARLLELVEQRRCFLVCDESSLIKNHSADRTLAMWRLGERCQYKLILNGTPLANNEKDLFAQWYLLDQRILGYSSFYSFAANHLEYDPERPGRIVRAHNVGHLVRKITPYTYQVRKDECLDLPPKTYSARYYCLERWERDIYEAAKDTVIEKAYYQNGQEVIPESYVIYQMFNAVQRVISGVHLDGEPIYKSPAQNPRVQLLLETIEEIPSDRKVIIWCKYTHEIETLREVLADHGGVATLYGELSHSKRDAELQQFNESARFLVANKRVGSFGLNLQHCSYAIYYSNDFSWETRAQSEDRIHRQGQKQNCHIIDLVCANSIDDRIRSCLLRKESLVDSFRSRIDQTKDKKELANWLDGDSPSAVQLVRGLERRRYLDQNRARRETEATGDN